MQHLRVASQRRDGASQRRNKEQRQASSSKSAPCWNLSRKLVVINSVSRAFCNIHFEPAYQRQELRKVPQWPGFKMLTFLHLALLKGHAYDYNAYDYGPRGSLAAQQQCCGVAGEVCSSPPASHRTSAVASSAPVTAAPVAAVQRL